MSLLDDLKAFFTPDADEDFEHRPYDPAKAHAAVIKGVQSTRERFDSTEPLKGRSWIKRSNSSVEFRPTYKGEALDVGERRRVKADKFPAALDTFEKAVKAGLFDDQFERIDSMGKSTSYMRSEVAGDPVAKKSRAPRSQAAIDAARATRARNKAAKLAGQA
ncbi:hypothetical protein SAMN06297144_1857 [Sphingomonas guangdongensis]|uniref:Uncharacterized protein n=1 Tax=Sphingomonas guangdongensis TaxID=1141890 RepID=A0A285QZ43_9SPHN|nr:hypothetical protein [Sphingomonas guangdongensis]SOB86748.1 hypothetical protein SAMN06297144_1857 [Sphingomonas guangdongensis]